MFGSRFYLLSPYRFNTSTNFPNHFFVCDKLQNYHKINKGKTCCIPLCVLRISIFCFKRRKMAAKIIAQIVIQGTTILTKAFFTAYQQALHNAKSGGAAAPNMAAKVMKYKLHPDEALQILNIDKTLLSRGTLDERYKILFAANDTKKGGSFYLQSKIFRAKEVLDSELKALEKPTDGAAVTGDGTTEKPSDDDGTEKTEKK